MKFLALFLSTLSLPAAAASSLASVLASMDAAAASFKSLTANLRHVNYTAIINDTSEQGGEIRVLKTPKGLQMLIEFSGQDPTLIAFADRKAEKYYPKILTVYEYDLGKHRALVDQFLMLGFGTSGRDLTRNFTVKFAGEETISGQKTTHLELVAKSRELAEKLKQAELWVDAGGQAVRQKFVERSGNYTLASYTDMKVNGPLPPESVRLKLPAGVKREYPMK
jgi:outer membrane lipoprotein-sorting protein